MIKHPHQLIMTEKGHLLEQKYCRYKKELKDWEREFEQSNGRQPTRDDIGTELRGKYKKYAYYKDLIKKQQKKKTGNPQSDEQNFSTPKKKKPVAAEDPAPGSEEENEEEDTELDRYTELGPTPQLQGRVLGLFDVQTPSSTPSKRKRPTNDDTNENNISSSPPTQQVVTPSKKNVHSPKVAVEATPDYLGKNSSYVDDYEISPMKPPRGIRKSFMSLIAESKQFRQELQQNGHEEDTQHTAEEQEENNPFLDSEEEKLPQQPAQYKKKPTQKRSKRRYKLRAVNNQPDDDNNAKKKVKPQEHNYQRIKLRHTTGYKLRRPFPRRQKK